MRHILLVVIVVCSVTFIPHQAHAGLLNDIANAISSAFGGNTGGNNGNCNSCSVIYSGITTGGVNFQDTDVPPNGGPDAGDLVNNTGGGNSGNNGGSTPTVPSPAGRCTITLTPNRVERGPQSIRVTIGHTPLRGWNHNLIAPGPLRRNAVSVNIDRDVTYALQETLTDTFTANIGTYTYTYSFSLIAPFGLRQGNEPVPDVDGSQTYTCTARLTVTEVVTECNDNSDNADTEDAAVDERDPGCHTDGNPNNAASYRPLDTSEVNPYADMRPVIVVPAVGTSSRPISVTASARNHSTTYAPQNSLVYGWRKVGSTPASCGVGGAQCFTRGSTVYRRTSTYTFPYSGNQSRSDTARSFTPSSAGTYEVCAIADSTNAVAEGVAGEGNNTVCDTVLVAEAPVTPPTNPTTPTNPTNPTNPTDPTDPTTPTTDPTPTGPLTITAPAKVRRENLAQITWNTGGRTACTITGTNGDTIELSGRATGTEPSEPITSETTYTITCGNEQQSAVIKLVAMINEQ